MRKLRLLHRYIWDCSFPRQSLFLFLYRSPPDPRPSLSPNKSTGYVPPAWLVEVAQLQQEADTNESKQRQKTKPTQTESVSQDSAVDKKNELPRKSSSAAEMLGRGHVGRTDRHDLPRHLHGVSIHAGAPRVVWGITTGCRNVLAYSNDLFLTNHLT